MNIHCELVLRRQQPPYEPFPTTACFWIDPYWTGCWVDGVEEEDSMRFCVQYQMTRMPAATLRPLNQGLKRLNPTVKVQFFMPLNADTSVVQDFRYSASFPVSVLFVAGQTHVCGLWNENEDACNQMDACFLPHVKLHVRTVSASVLPRTVPQLAAGPVPNKQSHIHVFTVANWIEDTLRDLYPKEDSIFFLPRTVGRNPFQDFFFTDAQDMYQTSGTNLPPTLALYVLCNALIVQGLTLATAERLILCPPTSKEHVTRLLSLMRDVLMCFTLCPVEGKYREDRCMGKPTEDQPQCLQFTRADKKELRRQTIFGEDDCEGLDQQGCVHMVELFCAIAGVHDHEPHRLKAHFAEHAMQSPLQVNPDTQERLLALAIGIGELFLEGILEAHMCEAESLISRFTVEQQQQQQQQQHEGHSFGMLLYEHGFWQGAVLMENTGIECIVRGSGAALERKAGADLANIARAHRDQFGMRIALTHRDEDRLYQKIRMGKGILFFTQRAHGGPLEYGATPSLVNTRFVRYEGGSMPSSSSSSLDGEEEEYAVLVPVEKMLEAMSDGTGPWPPMADAERMLWLYRRLKEQYRSFARIWMPPQDTEDEYMARICKHWGRLEEQHLITRDQARMRLLATIADHPRAHEAFRRWLQQYGARAATKSHRFMHSTIFLVDLLRS